MRTLWMFHRRLIMAVALVVAVAISAGVVLVGSRHDTAAVSSPALQSDRTKARRDPSSRRRRLRTASTEDGRRAACDRHRTTGRHRAGPGGDPVCCGGGRGGRCPRPGDLCRLPDRSLSQTAPTRPPMPSPSPPSSWTPTTQSRPEPSSWPGPSTRRPQTPCPGSRPRSAASPSCFPWPTRAYPAVRPRRRHRPASGLRTPRRV